MNKILLEAGGYSFTGIPGKFILIITAVLVVDAIIVYFVVKVIRKSREKRTDQ